MEKWDPSLNSYHPTLPLDSVLFSSNENTDQYFAEPEFMKDHREMEPSAARHRYSSSNDIHWNLPSIEYYLDDTTNYPPIDDFLNDSTYQHLSNDDKEKDRKLMNQDEFNQETQELKESNVNRVRSRWTDKEKLKLIEMANQMIHEGTYSLSNLSQSFHDQNRNRSFKSVKNFASKLIKLGIIQSPKDATRYNRRTWSEYENQLLKEIMDYDKERSYVETASIFQILSNGRVRSIPAICSQISLLKSENKILY